MPEGESVKEGTAVFKVNPIFGSHLSSDELVTAEKRLEQGDLIPQGWDKEVDSKVGESRVISIDSLGTTALEEGKDDLPLQAKKRIFTLLPGMSVFKNEANIVLGDLSANYWSLISKNAEELSKHEAADLIKKELDKARPWLDAGEILINERTDDRYYLLGAFIGGVASSAVGLLAVNKSDEIHGKEKNGITRREFLAGAGGIAATFGLFALQKRLGLAPSKKEASYESGEKVDYTSIDGRTALHFQKVIDASAQLGEREPAVILGNAHKHNSDKLLNSEKERHEAIKNYAVQLLKVWEGVAQAGNLSEEDKQIGKGLLLGSMIYTQVVSLEPIEKDRVSSGEVDKVIDEQIKFKTGFRSPGVAKALEPLKTPLIF